MKINVKFIDILSCLRSIKAVFFNDRNKLIRVISLIMPKYNHSHFCFLQLFVSLAYSLYLLLKILGVRFFGVLYSSFTIIWKLLNPILGSFTLC